ncbi:DNA helicase [Microcystis aeruginosa]
MSLVLQVITTVLSEPSRFIRERAELNLPDSMSSFPFRKKQREAVELALSNAPLVAIAGTPASGKTEIALASLETAIAHQRSTLVVVPFASTFNRYENLPLPPLQISSDRDYRQNVKTWLRQQVAKPKLDFLPPNWLEDSLFEELQIKSDRQFWLRLLREEDSLAKIQKLTQAVAEIFPNIHPKRQELLVYRLSKSETLLEQRERLHQDYTTLSDHAIEQILDAALPHIKAPILCLSNQLAILGERTFDLVIVEDSHYLNDSTLQAIATRTKKIVLLGELTEPRNLFSRLFQSLSPAYRLQLAENHRLHPDLARKIFPGLYPMQPMPYSPSSHKHSPLSQGEHRLNWLKIKTAEQIPNLLQQSLESFPDQQSSVLTFSSELRDRLQQIPYLSHSNISTVQDWTGKECQTLWIVCDKSESSQPNLTDIRLALTRARDKITIIGDWEYYQNTFDALGSDFHFVRDIAIKEG